MPQLTDTRLRSLKPRSGRHIVWDRNGLGIRIGATGNKSFIYTYRQGNRVRWVTLGTYPALSLADARLKHAEAIKAKSEGHSPADTALVKRQQLKDAPTVTGIIDYYIERYAKRHKKSWKEDERLLRKDLEPRIGTVRAQDVKRRDIIDILEDIADRGAPVTANRTLAVITRMFNFAVERELLDATPCAGIRRIHKERSRQRVLTEDEIRKFWHGLSNGQMTDGVRLALKLMLLTGQRRAEVVEATWSEFDLENGWWTIPESRTKNRQSHRVPLTSFSAKILEDIQAESRGSDYLFPSPMGARPITARAVTRAVHRNAAVMELTNFVPHDLRRTVASHMAGIGVSRLIIAKVLNHADTAVTAIYDRYSYDQEKREGLEMWADRLEEIVSS